VSLNVSPGLGRLSATPSVQAWQQGARGAVHDLPSAVRRCGFGPAGSRNPRGGRPSR